MIAELFKYLVKLLPRLRLYVKATAAVLHTVQFFLMLDWLQVRYHYPVVALVLTHSTVYSHPLVDNNWISSVHARIPAAEYIS